MLIRQSYLIQSPVVAVLDHLQDGGLANPGREGAGRDALKADISDALLAKLLHQRQPGCWGAGERDVDFPRNMVVGGDDGDVAAPGTPFGNPRGPVGRIKRTARAFGQLFVVKTDARGIIEHEVTRDCRGKQAEDERCGTHVWRGDLNGNRMCDKNNVSGKRTAATGLSLRLG